MKRPSMFNLLPLPYLSLLLSVIYFLGPNVVDSALLQGCKLDNELCDENEACIPDGLFGQCYSDAASVSPLIIGEPLNEAQHEVLRAELVRLADNGLDWPDAISQCVLAYFKLSVAYDLAYDPNFCNVRNPTNVWALVQRVQTLLGEQPIVNANDVPSALLSEDSIAEEPAYDGIPIVVVGDDELPASELDALPEPIKQQNEKANNQTKNENVKRASNSTNIGDEKSNESDISEEEMSKIISQISELQNQMDYPELVVEESLEAPLSNDEQKELNQYVTAVLNDQASNIGELQPQQKRKLFMFVETLQNALDEEQLKPGSAPEIEEIVPLTSVANQQQLLLKKDTEKFNNADMGLANTVHKIVKGDIQRVEGNRVYLRVNQNEIREDEIYKLIAYLDKKIAEPNNLYFDEFAYDDGQLSFRVSRFDAPRPKEHKNEKRVDSASGVAQAVYKRRKDIQTLAGVEVDETGIGSGVDVVPVEKNERDWLFFPILFICAFTITTLISVLAVHLFKNRRRTFRENLPEVIDTLEGGKATFAYEELCRQRNRMSVQDGAVGIPSKTSSTSSWYSPDESLLQTSELDISTGHIILGFLTEHLERPEKIVEQWKSVENYVNTRGETTIATSAENTSKNRDPDVLPFDENVVTLQPANGDLTQGLQYINASKIHDSDLRHVAYIATQAPLQDTIAEFWQMVWEQGIALIVNLCTQDDIKNNKCDRYWPEEGAKAYGTYEIHLVSEHIWSEDYMVRSFYLKNLNTNETRTVTQFHYISWTENGVPASNKSLLEFRRKVNRSYRGKASPVLVHCSNGSDRTGTYILIDMVVNRIAKGIKELNIAGTVEFLRDQRMKCCQNIEQFKLVFSCVADEVTSLLKNLQH